MKTRKDKPIKNSTLCAIFYWSISYCYTIKQEKTKIKKDLCKTRRII